MWTIGDRMRFIGNGIDSNQPLDARGERALALARAFIAVSALVALYVWRDASVARTDLARVVLPAYVVIALVTLIQVQVKRQISMVHAVVLHIVDLGIAAAATAPAQGGVSSPFFVLLLFTLLSAAYRWGFAETVVTACAAVVLLIVSAVATSAHPATLSSFLAIAEPERLMMRSSFLLVSGALVGYIAQSEKRLRSEAMLIGSFVGHADARGLKKTLTALLDAALNVFEAQRAVLIIHERASDQVFQWEATLGNGPLSARCTQLDREQLPTFLFAPAVSAAHVVRRDADRFDIIAIDREGNRLARPSAAFAQRCLAAVGPFRALIAASVDFGDEWSGRLFLGDPVVGMRRLSTLEFIQRLLRQVAPAAHNVFLMHRLRTMAGQLERARLARELHDGVIQSVTGVEMQIEALSLGLAKTWPPVVKELKRLDGILRQEVAKLRDKMYLMRPIDVGPDQLVAALDEFVQRFQRETGITAHFVSQLDRVALAPRACREVAQILSEALINVRRHSGARNVFVRLDTEERACRLSIDDDGCGFPFAGRLTQADLERARKGPSMIRERVRLIGGELTIESDPGHGTRLEIAVPLSHYVVQ